MRITKPKALKKKDLIGLVAPAGPLTDVGRIERGVRYIESLGYRVIVGKNAALVHGYLAGTDQLRLDDLHAMFADRKVKAIFCLRGGFGATRLLEALDYRMIRRNPKILVGYSDITALQLALWKKCGLVTFHGPMAGVEMANAIDPITEEVFWHLVTSKRKFGNVDFSEDVNPQPLTDGRTTGRLVGGNLSLVVSLLGTPYQPEFLRSILFLEEIGEEPYRIDRMLTHLRSASILQHVNGVLFGQFVDCEPKNGTTPSRSLHEVITEVAHHSAKPCLANLPFGHLPRKMTLPVGVNIRMDGGEGKVEFLEAAVE